MNLDHCKYCGHSQPHGKKVCGMCRTPFPVIPAKRERLFKFHAELMPTPPRIIYSVK